MAGGEIEWTKGVCVWEGGRGGGKRHGSGLDTLQGCGDYQSQLRLCFSDQSLPADTVLLGLGVGLLVSEARRGPQGVEYSKSMKTGWKLPAKIRKLMEVERQAVRDKFHILVEGQNLLPPVTKFEDLKFPACILNTLKSKGINRPTPIQMQVRV